MRACFLAPSCPKKLRRGPGLGLGAPGLRSQGVLAPRGGEGTDASPKASPPVKSLPKVCVLRGLPLASRPSISDTDKTSVMRVYVLAKLFICHSLSEEIGFTEETVVQRE